jgi:hypothetical protein
LQCVVRFRKINDWQGSKKAAGVQNPAAFKSELIGFV